MNNAGVSRPYERSIHQSIDWHFELYERCGPRIRRILQQAPVNLETETACKLMAMMGDEEGALWLASLLKTRYPGWKERY